MQKMKLTFTFLLIAVSGGITPLMLPNEFFSYVLGVCAVMLLIFAILAAGSAEHTETGRMGYVWRFVIGASDPAANLSDRRALLFFFLILTYIAGFTVGAFNSFNA